MSIINVTKKGFATTAHRNSAASCVAYLDEEKPHNATDQVMNRTERKTCNVGDLAQVIARQKGEINYRKNTPQAFSIVQSFDKDELNPESVSDIDKAHEIGVKLANYILEKFGDRAYAVYTQRDGESHHLHNHIVILNFDKNRKSLDGGYGLSWRNDLLPMNEAVSAQYFKSDKQKAIRAKTLVNAEKARNRDNDTARALRDQQKTDRRQHIKDAFNVAIATATTQEDFTTALKDQGITILARKTKQGVNAAIDPAWNTKKGAYRKSLTFEYQGLKVRSNKLGYSTEQVVDKLLQNKLRQQQRLRQQQAIADKPQLQQSSKARHSSITVLVDKPRRQQRKAVAVTTDKQFPTRTLPTKKPFKKPEASAELVNVVKHPSRQQVADLLRLQVQLLIKRMQQEKRKEQRERLQQKIIDLSQSVADITSQIAVDATAAERRREQREDEEYF